MFTVEACSAHRLVSSTPLGIFSRSAAFIPLISSDEVSAAPDPPSIRRSDGEVDENERRAIEPLSVLLQVSSVSVKKQPLTCKIMAIDYHYVNAE